MKARTKRLLAQEARGVAWTLPALVFLLLFTLYPMVNAIITSFYNWNLTGRKKYIGLYNYQKLFGSAEIYETIWRTVQYAIIVLPITLVLGFVLALMLKRSSKLNVVFRTMLFTPRVSSMVAISVVWLFIYNPQYGLLNSLLGLMGIPPVRWLNETSSALPSIALITIWRMLGYSTVVYLGGIQNISEDVLEASTIDGANALQTVWHITAPLTSPTTFMLLILNSIEVLKMFTTINVMTDGGPAKATQNLVVMLYEYAFRRYQVGYASAIALVLFLLILIINLVQMACERFVSYDS
ncbi:MAG: sugar ABC transporter permease [Clostridiales bacterium]|nr:sugar ABC transporter permease [Clostridiales bacterium]MDO4351388.1 sugar ABC transporter permease [Eubacteriales bacterium]MDY4009368.1 sugar ABC transporter permease [Candidatus Limiplasma sp.]